MTSTQLTMDQAQLKALSELLLGVAYADGDYDGTEAAIIGDVLRQLVVDDILPTEVSMHLSSFNVEALSIADATARLNLEGKDERSGIISLMLKVADADGVYDCAESDYITEVANALGASADEKSEFAIEIIYSPEPPPMPVV